MWMKLCLFVFVYTILVSASEEEWKKFKMTLGTKYSASQEAHRKQLFLKADQIIQKHNSENHTWTMKHSLFSVMTKEEKRNYFGRISPDNISSVSYGEHKSLMKTFRALTGLPAALDLRNDPCMAPVKDQGQCGSCWAFGATNPIEFASCKNRGNKLIVLSEQFSKDCTYAWNASNTGCQGGFEGKLFEMLAFNSTQRMAASSKYPYVPVGAPCRYTPDMAVEDTQVIDWAYVKGENNEMVVRNMMEVLNFNMTINVAVYVPDEWGSYGAGVFTNKTDCDKSVNHAVVVVGYGTLNSVDYWIVRNSWGPGWGDHGYVKMRRGVNQCRIEAVPLFPILV